jgi:glycogen debranching enzyme
MRVRTALLCLAALLPAFSSAIHGQNPSHPPAHPGVPQFTPVAPIAFDTGGPVLRAHTETLKPFTVAGERGVLLGQQDGTFEAWVLPVKLLSHLTIEAEIEGYTVPIDVNQQSAEIEVRPDRTVITYAHLGFTVRQIMFSPEQGPAGTGPVVLFEFDCLHPTDFTFRFTPALEYMWPERNEGHPGPEWVAPGPSANEQLGGYYVIHADYPDLAGAITIPGARPGILAPYQERPQVHPVELKLHIDPERDRSKLYPLLMASGTNKQTADTRALGATLEKLNQSITATYTAHADSYRKLLASSVSIDTPDKTLNEAFQWAVISIEQLKAHPVGTDETALVAGYYSSGDSARPGFGWFFGRDALYTLYAVNGYGDFGLSKSELEFLIKRQRADGKIMHEYSQTASQIDWLQFPYMYAAADSTPLFLLAMLDYVRASGDTDFLKTHRDAVEKAWAFETDPAHDTDHDGIYDNSQGTGWVESWPGGMPHQEIYLALLDQQASQAYGELQRMLGNQAEAGSGTKRASDIATKIEQEYYDAQSGCYAFATNPAGTPNSPVDRTRTVYPALAWWSGFGNQSLVHGDTCLQQLASHTLNTDWGLRDVSNDEKIYDGMSYHQGSVWPLFTGWAALAEYRGNQPLAGYQMLMENANLTRAQDLGADTELLSGDFFIPFGRSTSHQLWSSAMVITPALRGLFGISIDAQTKTITVNPHLPALWKHASINNLQLPGGEETLSFEPKGQEMVVEVSDWHKGAWKVVSQLRGSRDGKVASGYMGTEIPLAPVELADARYSSIDAETGAANFRSGVAGPIAGSRTEQIRVIDEHWSDRSAKITFEGPAGATGPYFLLRHSLLPKLEADCRQVRVADSSGRERYIPCTSMIDAAARDPNVPILMMIQLPPGQGWKTVIVTLTW